MYRLIVILVGVGILFPRLSLGDTASSPQTPDDVVFRGFDCSSPRQIYDINFEATSMCATKETRMVKKMRKFQLLQKEKRRQHEGYACKVYESQTASYCGVYDHQTQFPGGTYHARLQHTTVEACRQMVRNQVVTHRGMDFSLDASC